MPRRIEQLPPDATSLARRIAALEREVREMRAAKRAAHTAVATGGMRLVDADGNTLAEMVPDFRDGESAFITYDTRSTGQEYYAALTAGDVAFGVSGVTQTHQEGRVSYWDFENGITELMLSSGNRDSGSTSTINMYSGLAGQAESQINAVSDKFSVFGQLTARNFVFGTTLITPSAASTPTAGNVGGLSIPGETVRVLALPLTNAPGTGVTGIGVTGVSSAGFTLWLTRTTTTATSIFWMAVGQ
ncbi:hypothetical protein [Streptomyces sp. NPDC091212]|uniref:hypothetical protein n=1 Tax=Streptomyces sp. NPDC091212 TaxID=3155191 RepID=UPI00341F81D9